MRTMAVLWEALATRETTVAAPASSTPAPMVWELLQVADLLVSLPEAVLPSDKWELLQTVELIVATSTPPSPVTPTPSPSGGTPSWVLPVVIGGAALLLLTSSEK